MLSVRIQPPEVERGSREADWAALSVALIELGVVPLELAQIAALLVELFPTRIRYSGLSLPYHIGNGWFGGLLPATAFAISPLTNPTAFKTPLPR